MNEVEFIKKMKRKGWDEKIVKIFIRDWFRCQYCGLDGLKDKENYTHLTIDPIIPQNLCGKYDEENLVVACAQCSRLKSLRLPRDIKEKIKNHVPPREILKEMKEWMKSKRKQVDASFDEWKSVFGDMSGEMGQIMRKMVRYVGDPALVNSLTRELYEKSGGNMQLLRSEFSSVASDVHGPFDLPAQFLSSIVKEIEERHKNRFKK